MENDAQTEWIPIVWLMSNDLNKQYILYDKTNLISTISSTNG